MKASARLKASTTTPLNPVFVQRSPFVSAERLEIPLVEGSYLSDYVAIASTALPAPLRPHIEVMLGEQVIDRRYWHRIKPKAGTNITVRVRPGGKAGKAILRIIILVAVVVGATLLFGPHAGFIATTLHLSGTAATAVSAALIATTTFAAQLALNALIPPPKLSGSSENSRPVLTGTSNKFEPYGPIPRLFGKTRCYPRIVGHPYTEINGHDQYLRMLLCAGYGPIKISDIKIGETPLLDFAGASVEVTEGGPAGWAGNKTLTLYSRQVREVQLSIELDDAGTTIAQTTQPNTSEISVDVAFPAGLVTYTKKGEKDVRVVDLYVQYSPAGLGDWQPANFLNSDFDTGIKGGGHIQARANSQEVVRLTGRWTVPAGQYDVRIVRNTAAGQQVPGGKNEIDRCQWTALRSVTNDAPVNQTGVTLIAVRLKATDQLNGIPQEINCIAEAYLPVRDRASGTWSYQLTSNPAWAYADVFRRRGPETIIPDNRLDLDEIQDWADECAATATNAAEPMWRFDGQMESGSILAAAKQIAACARASFVVREGKFSVVRDKVQATPVQHFTPRNSWGYTGTRTFPDQPHALRCRFSNSAKNYVDDEVIVYADGYSAANATKYDTLEFYGMTSATQVFREGRYHLAVGKLRPEEHTISCDIEALRCTLGSRVQLSHDVILVGQAWGRVTGRTLDGAGKVIALEFDEQVIFEPGKTYSLRSRAPDGSSSIRVALPPDGSTIGTYNAISIAAESTATAPDVGDLFMFGETGLESAPMVVKKIESGDNLSAVLTLVPYDEAIFTSDVNAIPAFSSYITQPVDVRQIAPPAPIVKLRSDDSVIDVLSDGTTVYRLAVDLAPSASAPAVIDHWEVEYRETGSDFWQPVPPAAASVKTVFIQPVRKAATYDVRARSVGSNGRPSSWVEVDSYVIVGKTIGPELPTAPALDPGYHSVAIMWTNPQDLDLAAVEVLRNTVNNSATAVQVGASLTGLHVDQDLAIQPFYYWLRARDTSGNPSALVACGSTTPLNVIQYEQIGADGVLHPAEKLTVVREFNELDGEHTRLIAQADAYAVGAERDALDTAYNNLSTYLLGLGPVLWSNMSGPTTIPDRGVWNSKWQAAYDARSALLNKIDDITAQISNAVSFTQYGTAPGSSFSIIGNRVAKKRGSSTDWDALMITRESFVAAARLRFQPGSANAYGMAGLIETLPSPSATFTGTNGTESWRQLPFAFYLPGDGSLAVYESAVYIGTLLPAGSIQPTDALEIVYRNGTITYLRNGVVLRSITTAVGRRFYGAVTIAAALSAFTGFQLTEAPVQSTSLANAGGMKVEGQAIEKVGGANSTWDSSAISLDAFTGGCTLSFTADSVITTSAMIGLNQDPTTDNSYMSLDYAIYLTGDGSVLTYESNTSHGAFTTWTPGDRFMVRYNGTTITYYKNGVAFRTLGGVSAGLTFYMDSSFYSTGARVKDILFVGAGSDGANGSDGQAVTMIFQRSAAQPATPGASAGTPAGWYGDVNSVPSGSNLLWASVGTRPSPSANYTWQTPIKAEGSPGANAKLLTLNATGEAMHYSGSGAIVAGQTIRFDIIGQNLTSSTCVVRAYRKNSDGSETQIDAGDLITTSFNSFSDNTPDSNSFTQALDYVTVAGTYFATQLGSGIGLIVEVSADGFTARRTIGVTKDGATGAAGGYPAQSVGGAVPSSGTFNYSSSITLAPGASINVTGEVVTQSTFASGGNVSAQIQYAPSGSGSWSVAGGASGSSPWFNDGTPANIALSGTFTNSGTQTMVYDIRLSVSKTGGSVNFDQSQTFFKAG